MPSYMPAGTDAPVNTQVAGTQGSSRVVPLPSGGYAIVWADSGTHEVRARTYSSTGDPVGAEVLIDANLGYDYLNSVVPLPSGGFMVTWQQTVYLTNTSWAQLFDSDGNPTGSPFNIAALGSTAALAGGGFVVTYAEYVWADGNILDVKAQLLDASGAAVGAPFSVPASTAGDQFNSSVMALPGGGFVIAWQDDEGSASSMSIRAQTFDSTGNKVGAETTIVDDVPVSGAPTLNQFEFMGPLLETLTSGGYVAVWNAPNGADQTDVFAQIFGADGTPVGGTILVNTVTLGLQFRPAVTAMPDGGFAIAWEDYSSGSGSGQVVPFHYADIKVQVFDATGAKVGDEILANDLTEYPQVVPSIAALTNGDIVVSWADSNPAHGDVFGNVRQVLLTVPETGTAAAETLTGTTASDALIGLAGNDTLDLSQGGNDSALGGEGDDTFVFGSAFSARDRIDGGIGFDTLLLSGDYSALPNLGAFTLTNVERISLASGSNYVLRPNNGNVAAGQVLEVDGSALASPNRLTFVGTAETDGVFNVSGGTGSDNLTGGAGNDTLSGGDGNDTLDGRAGTDSLSAGGGNDIVTSNFRVSLSNGFAAQDWDSRLDHDILAGGDDDDQLWIGYGDDADGGSGTDTLFLSFGGLTGGVTFDTAGLSAQPLVLGGGTIQNIEFLGQLFGTRFADTFTIATQPATVTVDAGAGNDTITAGRSTVAARGGTGDDSFFSGSAADTFDGGSGFDTVFYSNHASGITLSADASGTWTGADGGLLSAVEKVVGSEYADTLTSGGEFSLVWGGGGNDTLAGGSGSDQLSGNDGDDTIVISHVVGAGEVFEGNAGFDTLELHPFASVPGQISFFSFEQGPVFQVERLQFASTASAPVNAIVTIAQIMNQAGGGQLTHVVGGSGVDRLVISLGLLPHESTYTVPDLTLVDWNSSATPHLTAGDEIMLVANDSSPYTLNAREGLTSTQHLIGGGGNDRMNGSSGVDVLEGGAGVDLLYGKGGNDVLDGGDSNDTIDGGAASDTMTGGTGNDTFYVRDAGDSVFEAAGEGDDTVIAYKSFALGAGQEVETLRTPGSASTSTINLTGNEFAQTLLGNAGSNALNGGGGADYLRGYAGNDTYYVDNAGDVVIEAAGGGADTVIATASFTLGTGQEVETLRTLGSAATYAVNLTGNAIAQTLIGNAAANVLDGKGGADTMVGYAGNDTYYVDNAADSVIEASGGGSDTVIASVSYTLGTGRHIEVLRTLGSGTTAPLNLTGNEFANTLYGNAAANVLDGKLGGDTMRGYAGNDTYYVDHFGDSVIEAAGGGSDTVIAKVSHTLAAGQEVELLRTWGSGTTDAVNLTGNDLVQTIHGNAAANVLNGGGGSDTLRGYAGNDTFEFTTALGAGNVDTILDFNAADDRMVLDDAVFAGLGPGALAAGAFATGSAAADADDRIIYNSATGALLFDADGVGGAAAVHFAMLTGAPTIAANDFLVV